jgi:RND family efflux transporter MFP subunit
MLRLLRRPVFWLVILGVIAVGGVGGTMFTQAQAKKAKIEAEAKAKPVETPFSAIANGKADVEGGLIQVAARTSGIIEDVFVQEGQDVKRGQILAKLEDAQLRLAEMSAQAELAQARALVSGLSIRRETAQRELARYDRLAEAHYIAGQKIDQMKDDLRVADAGIETQQAAIATAEAKVAQARYNLELTNIRAPADGRIVRRYANPGAGASTLNVSNMFDLEPRGARIVRAEIAEAALSNVAIGQAVELAPESDDTKIYVGTVLRRSALFGARKLQSDDPSEKTDERVVEVVVSADSAPFLIGQRVLVKFMKPGKAAGVKRPAPAAAADAKKS